MEKNIEVNAPRFIYPCEFKIMLDKNLNDFDRKLYILIITLSGKYNFCWANNQYLSQICDCTIRNIQYSLQKLLKNDYIFIEIKNGKRIIRNYIDIAIDNKNVIIDNLKFIDEFDWLNN